MVKLQILLRKGRRTPKDVAAVRKLLESLGGISHDGGATTSCVHHDAVSYPGSDPNMVSAGGRITPTASGAATVSAVAAMVMVGRSKLVGGRCGDEPGRVVDHS